MTEPRHSQDRQSAGYLKGVARLLGQIEQLPAVIWTTDPALRFTSSAGMGLASLGLEPDQVVGKSLFEYFQTEDRTFQPIAMHLRALQGEHVTFEQHFNERVFVTQVAPLRDDAGAIEGTLGVALDITSSKQVEEALRLSEAHYRALVEEAPIGIFRSSNAGRFLTVNRALVKMLGYDSDAELLGLDLAAEVYVDPNIRLQLVTHFSALSHVHGVDVDWRRRDDSRITVRLSGQPVRDAAGQVEAWEMVAEDVTERRRLEAQLRAAQKMEALGLVTGGVAHDFNNILTTIIANTELIGSALPASMAQVRSDLLEIRDAAERGGDLVKKLLGFSRRERLSMQPTDVGAVVTEIAEVLRRLVPERVTIHVSAESDLPRVLADAGALQQILLNLAANSRDAIAEHGDIWISAGRTTLDAAHVAEFGWGTAGEYVAITLRDSGLGMDEATQRRVFEPFFTTKPPGAGSGLGLSMVYGLMKQQNGFIGVASVPGQGTTVTLHLPITGRRTPDAAKPAVRRQAGNTILVVEDEEPIRRVAQRVLERHGFKVLTASDGVEALALYRDHEADVALILTDVIMPRMGGKALHQTLRSAGKQVPVVFMSGYAARGETLDVAQIDPDTQILPKPWSVDQLVARVREAIGTADG
jgi:PAS domain S-box-containing protein